jgi:KaiC/GvpD/RAD55 family RecA-like ATPase/mannitol/fructose-specific phosphotransferase system IIA component (Ntr-type)
MSSMELRLLRSIVDRGIYDECRDRISSSMFSEDLQDIAEAIIDLHAEFSTGVDMGVVLEHLLTKKVSSTAKNELLGELVNKINNVEPVDYEVSKKFLTNLALRDQRITALNKLARIIERNGDSHEDVISILSRANYEEEADGEIVGHALTDMEKQYTTKNKFPFNVPKLQEAIGGLSKGNLLGVFGRPEVGKSSFVASLVAGYIKRGITTEYYANEEPGIKIMLNIRRAATGEDDRAIALAIRNKKDPTDWPLWAKSLTVRQISDMSIETIMSRAQKANPEVIVLDQVDKLSLREKYNAGHERLRALYEKSRMIAKSCDCLVINVSQASIDAEGRYKVPYSMMDGSKTGKGGELDVALGIGKSGDMHKEDEDPRMQEVGLMISKNKVNGWHGTADAYFNAHTNQWSDNNDSGRAAT